MSGPLLYLVERLFLNLVVYNPHPSQFLEHQDFDVCGNRDFWGWGVSAPLLALVPGLPHLCQNSWWTYPLKWHGKFDGVRTLTNKFTQFTNNKKTKLLQCKLKALLDSVSCWYVGKKCPNDNSMRCEMYVNVFFGCLIHWNSFTLSIVDAKVGDKSTCEKKSDTQNKTSTTWQQFLYVDSNYQQECHPPIC